MYLNYLSSGILDITVKGIYQLIVGLVYFMAIISHNLVISTILWYVKVRLD